MREEDPSKAPLVYVICSRHQKDVKGLELLEKLLHLEVAKRSIALWHRGMIRVGQRIDEEWRRQLAAARVVVVLVSPDLVVDREEELQVALQRQAAERGRADEVKIFPIRYRPSLLPTDYFGGAYEYPADGEWLSVRSEASEDWTEIARAILDAATSREATSKRAAGAAAGGGAPTRDAASAGEPKVRVLLVGANPRPPRGIDVGQVDISTEAGEIERRLRNSQSRDRFDLRYALAAQVADLTELMLRHRPTVVHFSTHGLADGRMVLEDGAGRALPVTGAGLARLFRALRKNAPRGVILSACFGTEAAAPLAEVLDFVIYADGALPNRTTWAFAAGFYAAAASGEPVDTAVELGKAQVELLGEAGADQYHLLCRPDVDGTQLRLI